MPSVATIDGEALAANCVLFGRLLRRAGLPVDADQTRTFVRVAGMLGLEHKGDVRNAGRVIYVRRREDRPIFDEAFDRFWRRRAGGGDPGRPLPRLRQGERRPGSLDFDTDTGRVEPRSRPLTLEIPRASSAEWVRTADFGELTGSEARDALRMLATLAPILPRRPSRRMTIGRRGHRPALRRMLRESLATGGEPIRWWWRARTSRPRPIVLLCDISGSMERYSRFMLRFAHALARAGAPLEVFVFGTRLTRITRQLRIRSADEALRRVADSVVDWSGGTRIGDCLRQLNRVWVRRTVRSGAVVLLVSDGWERGDPAVLGEEMARLRRACHRLVWLDPLASRAGFEPVTQGLVAALPHVDDLLPCASVASLERLGEMLRVIGRDASRDRGSRPPRRTIR